MNGFKKHPIVYFISDGGANANNFNLSRSHLLSRIHTAVETGVDLIQIREKNLTSKLLFDLTKAGAAITHGSGTKLLVNGRADIALAAGADGVHLPADGIPACVIRRSFPTGFLVGVSTHSAREGSSARSQGADFVTFGPVFATPGKSDLQGLDSLNAVCRLLDPFPVIALGGIDDSNYPEVVENGAAGFAAIRYLNDPQNLRKLAGITSRHHPQTYE